MEILKGVWIHMMTLQRWCLVSLAAGILILSAYAFNSKEWTTPNMPKFTSRLEPVFEKTKTVCFGRFQVDVPASATVVWGRSIVPLAINIYPDGVSNTMVMAQQFMDDLKSKKAINRNYVPLLISVDDVSQPEGKIITGYEDFESIDDFKINGYFALGNAGVVITAHSLREEKDDAIAEIKSIARRLQLRSENELPTQPGNCIENAFLPDKQGAGKDGLGELIGIGFRLKEFPDTHLSISLRPANPHYNESNSLRWQLERLEKNLRAENSNHPRLKTRYFRRSERQIHDWAEGFEALSRSPEQPDIYSIHDFGMDFTGVPSDALKPYADIRMQTGVSNNAAGAAKPSLTDEEAIAVWDKITSTIRVRPTSDALKKTAGLDPSPRFPLGELAATGRTCPQTGLWIPSEPSSTNESQRRYIQAGEKMPHVTVFGEPSLWQKLKRERPSHRMAAVWKLVDYNNVPASVNAAAGTARSAQALSETVAAKDAVNGATGGGEGEQNAPDKG